MNDNTNCEFFQAPPPNLAGAREENLVDYNYEEAILNLKFVTDEDEEVIWD